MSKYFVDNLTHWEKMIIYAPTNNNEIERDMIKSEDFKKNLSAMENAAQDVEQALNKITKENGLDASEAINVLQLLVAKAIIEENEKAGGGVILAVIRDFTFKMKLFLMKHLPEEECRDLLEMDIKNSMMGS